MRQTFRQGTHPSYRFDDSGKIAFVRKVLLTEGSGAERVNLVTIPGRSEKFGVFANGVFDHGWLVPIVGNPNPVVPELKDVVVEPPPPPPPATGIVARAGDNLATRFNEAMAANQPLILEADFTLPSTWNFGGGSGHSRRIRIDGNGHTITGTSTQRRFLYLGAPNCELIDLNLRGFVPPDSGTIGLGPGTDRTLLRNVNAVGSGQYDMNSHGVYVYGGGTFRIEGCDISGVGGAALHMYGSGSPVGEVIDCDLNSVYSTVMPHLGYVTISRTGFRGD